MKVTPPILLIAATLLGHLANAQLLRTLQCMQMESIVIPPSCSGFCDGSIDLLVTGGQPPYTYIWNTQNLNNLCAGEYLVTVTDANGCTADSSFLIIDPGSLDIVATGTDVSCFGTCDGSFDPDNYGGPWASYTLNYPVDLSALCSGEYVDVLTAYDQSGCPTVFTVIIHEPEVLNVEVFVTPISCIGACDGIVELDVTGGTPPYQFNIPPLCVGTFTIFVIDANGCLFSTEVIMSSIAELIFENVIVEDETNGQSNGVITIFAGGGTPPFMYSLNGVLFQSSNIFSGLAADTYVVSIKDSNGCVTETEVEVQNLTGVTELNTRFSYFPNPASSWLFFESEVPLSIEVMDIHGRRLWQVEKSVSQQIPVKDIMQGLYLLRISDGTGVTYRKVVVE